MVRSIEFSLRATSEYIRIQINSRWKDYEEKKWFYMTLPKLPKPSVIKGKSLMPYLKDDL